MEFVVGLVVTLVTAVGASVRQGKLLYRATQMREEPRDTGDKKLVPIFSLNTVSQTYQQVLFTSVPTPLLSADPVATQVIQATSTVEAEWFAPSATKRAFLDNLFYWVDTGSRAVSLTPGVPANNKPRVAYVPNERPTLEGPAKGAVLQVTMLDSWPSGRVKVIRVLALRTTVVYLELAGGHGGNMEVYSDSGERVGAYRGGRCGVMWAQVAVKSGQVIDIFLGQDGTPPSEDNLRNIVPAQDQGGVATMLGGANGGSASVAVMYDSLLAAENREAPVILMVAGGGGGAGRNAMGGSAGLQGITKDGDIKYGDVMQDLNPAGFGGSALNVLDATKADLSRTIQPNGASGGGGARDKGGKSPNSAENNGLFILTSNEITTYTGGGAARSSEVPAGGGGGGGYYGGACGGWNGFAKPNNLHGGGGGGSSYGGSKAVFNTTTGRPCLNVYRSAVVDVAPLSAYAVIGTEEDPSQ